MPIFYIQNHDFDVSETFTSVSNGTTITPDVFITCFSLQVTSVGTITSWTVKLQSSIDGTNFVDILTVSDTDGLNTPFFINGKCSKYFRVICSAITLGAGTSITARVLATE